MKSMKSAKSLKSTKSFSREAHDEEHAPHVQIRYFYTSPLAIDDPLSAVPPPTLSTSTPLRHAPRPFSKYDNDLLNQAWDKVRRKRNVTRSRERLARQDTADEAARRDSAAEFSPTEHAGKFPQISSIEHRFRSLRVPKSQELRAGGSRQNSLSSSADKPPDKQRASNIVWQNVYGDSIQRGGTVDTPEPHSYREDGSLLDLDGDTGGITGTPFIRAPARSKHQTFKRFEDAVSVPRRSSKGSQSGEDTATDDPDPSLPQADKTFATVAVGVSRLHQVLLPQLRYDIYRLLFCII